MRIPNQVVQEITDLQEQAAGLKGQADGLSAEAYRKMQGLCDRIKGGESTGDRIKDFVIARYRCINKGIELAFRTLEGKVTRYVGEFVLMAVKQEQFYGRRGNSYGPNPSPFDYHVDEHLYLGTLNGTLILGPVEGNCELPTGRHVVCWNPSSEEVSLREGNIHDSSHLSDFGIHLDKPLAQKGSGSRWHTRLSEEEPELALEVKVGDEEVQSWFNAQPGNHHLIIFRKMAKLLNRPIPESPELAAELARRREEITKRLSGLEQEAAELQLEIDCIYGARERGVYSPDDDAFWISLGSRDNLKKIIGQIKWSLAIALELDMGNDVLVQRISKKYEVVGA